MTKAQKLEKMRKILSAALAKNDQSYQGNKIY